MLLGSTEIYKNGAPVKITQQVPSSTYNGGQPISDIIYLNGSTDYVELYGLIIASSGNNFYGATNDAKWTYMSGAMIRSA